MSKNRSGRWKNWVLITTTSLILLVGLGIFSYYYFFRQVSAELIETVPEDAVFVYQVNDPDLFKENLKYTLPIFKEILAFDAVAGCQFFFEKIAKRDEPAVFSGHIASNNMALLFSCKTQEKNFKNLLKSLQIDQRNHIPFNGYEIYTYGTHFKKFYFAFHHEFFSVSEDVEVVKKAIAQLSTLKSLTFLSSLKPLLKIVNKNHKQNWLMIQNHGYADFFEPYISDSYKSVFKKIFRDVEWSAFQMRCVNDQLMMTGYAVGEGNVWEKFVRQNPIAKEKWSYMPYKTQCFMSNNIPNPNAFVKHCRKGMDECAMAPIITSLQPSSQTLFTVNVDSLTHDYLAINATQFINDSVFFAHFSNVDSVKKEKYTYFTFDSLKCQPLQLDYLATQYFQALTYYDSTLIFATSNRAMEDYYAQIGKKKITDNRYYQLAQANMPSQANGQFFISEEQPKYWKRWFNQDAPFVYLKKVQTVSFNYAVASENIMTLNIYIKY